MSIPSFSAAWPSLIKTLLALSLVLVSSMVFGLGKKNWDPKGKVSPKSHIFPMSLLGVAISVLPSPSSSVSTTDVLTSACLHYRRQSRPRTCARKTSCKEGCQHLHCRKDTEQARQCSERARGGDSPQSALFCTHSCFCIFTSRLRFWRCPTYTGTPCIPHTIFPRILFLPRHCFRICGGLGNGDSRSQ